MSYKTLSERPFVNEEIEEDRRHEGKIINTPIGQALIEHFKNYEDVFLSTSSEKKVA